MNVIIAGGRTFNDYDRLSEVVSGIIMLKHRGANIEDTSTTIISGAARGVDTLGEDFAKEFSLGLEQFPAQWDKYGKSAGYVRNVEMADRADILVAFWDGESKGTKHMIDIALGKGLEVHVYKF